MKKNMISVIILALLIVNIVLTGVMMFSIVSTEKKTAKLIDGISTALNLELTPQSGSSACTRSIRTLITPTTSKA